MFSDDRWYWLTDEERAIRHSKIKAGVDALEKASAFNTKPNAPLISRKNLKRILIRHFKKIAIFAVSILTIAFFTWLIWPNPPAGGKNRKIAEAKAAAGKMETELQKEKEELLAAKAKELNQQKQTEAQDVKNDAPESKNENKEKKSGNPNIVFLGFIFGAGGIFLVLLAIKDWQKVHTSIHILMVVLPLLLLVIGSALIIGFWPRSETVSETVQRGSENSAVEVVNTTPQPTYAKLAHFLDRGHQHGNHFCYYVEIVGTFNEREGKCVYRSSKDGELKGHFAVNPETYQYLQYHIRGFSKIYIDSDFTPDPEEKSAKGAAPAGGQACLSGRQGSCLGVKEEPSPLPEAAESKPKKPEKKRVEY